MGRIRSEILFNRALLWLLMAELVGTGTPVVFALDIACAMLNFWKSYVAWRGE